MAFLGMFQLEQELNGSSSPFSRRIKYTKSWYKCCAELYAKKSIKYQYIKWLFGVWTLLERVRLLALQNTKHYQEILDSAFSFQQSGVL